MTIVYIRHARVLLSSIQEIRYTLDPRLLSGMTAMRRIMLYSGLGLLYNLHRNTAHPVFKDAWRCVMAGKQRLGDLLMDSKLITKDDLDKALRLQVGGNRRLGYLLIKMGFISEEQLHSVLSQQMDLPIVTIEDEFNPEVQSILPRYLCRKYSVIPLMTGENNTLKVAMVDPSDGEAVSDIEKYTGKIIRPVLTSKSDISSSIRSRIPWSLRDIFNSQTSTRLTAIVAAIAFLLIIITVTQLYQDRQQERYGTITSTAQSTTYENLELILGFEAQDKVSLFGRGAYSSGYYAVTFNDTQSLKNFINSKKDDFSAKQHDWLTWAMTNPRGTR